ncbi:hypothetical protein V5T82_14665 [Magnetovibrio sp. PR-2]|uniref:hypothetical protein n=1 Tax=Magnetovibrio sp. PR-2 TaxID=3120356 RepID=UPI002FCE1A45
MRFLIFNIVVVAALAFLVMDRPQVDLARAVPGDLSIPAVAQPEPEPAPEIVQPQLKPKPQPKPKQLTEMPELPPAKEVPVRVTHKAPRDVSPGLTQTAERIKAEITQRQNAPLPEDQEEPAQTAAVETNTYDKSVSRRKALMDLASDMELMFAEKMMR